MTTGHHNGDFYHIEPAAIGDVQIRYRTPSGREGRGDLLARALKGRLSVQPRSWWLTPARADKWRRLFLGDASARQVRVLGGKAWVFDGPDWVGLQLPDALDKVKSQWVLEVVS